MIIVDTREPASLEGQLKVAQDERVLSLLLPVGDILISHLNTIPSNVAEFLTWASKNKIALPEMDVIIANPQEAALAVVSKDAIGIERKTPTDFLNSISDGRLFDQGMRLQQAVKYPIVLITGFFYERGDKVEADGRETQWNWWSVQMAIFRLQMAGCAVLQCRSHQLPDVVSHLWQWLFKGQTYGRNPPPMPLIPLSPQANFLCGIPGIGVEKARAVMQYAGTAKDALHFLTSPATPTLPNRPEGIGVQTVAKIRDFMGLEPDQVLRSCDIDKD